MSIEQWALLTGLIAGLVAVPVWFHLRAARPRRIPRFAGKLGHRTRNREFIDFLTENRHHRIRLDVWMDDPVLAGADHGSAEEIRLSVPDDDPMLGDECEVTIQVDDRENSPLSHANGVWRLNGYVEVEGRMGVWQGIPSYHLVAIPLKAAAE